MEFTYEANLPLLRRLAILLMAFSDSDDSDLEEQFEIINASEEDLYDKEASENDRKSDEEIEKEAEEILSTIGNSILRLALSYLHNIEDAEDILQETMIKFVTVRPVFESEAHRKAWLMRVASNLAKNRIDYNRVRDTLELNEEIAGEVHLFYQEGYSTAEIAQITGRREATVRSDLKRARDRLREMLKEANDFE